MAVKPSDTLSSSFTSVDDLFDKATAGADLGADEEVTDTESEETDQSPGYEDADASPPDDEVTDGEESDQFYEIQANGKTHKIDRTNEEEVKRLLSFGLGARTAFSSAAKLRQENKQLASEMKNATTYKEKAELFDKLESVKDDQNELFRLITGGRSLDEVVAAKIKQKQEWESLDPVERTQMEAKAREEALIARIERMERKAESEREAAEKAKDEADEKQTYAKVYPEFQKVLAGMKITDPVEKQETASDLWSLGWDRIARLAKAAKEQDRPLDLTPEFVARQFAAVAKRWGYAVEAAADKKVAGILDKKSKDATKRAGLAATRNYGKSVDSKSLEGLSPSRAFDKIFGR